MKTKAEQFEFMRFVAFVMIFLWHANMYSLGILPTGTLALSGVSFFFVLSGFLSGFSSCEREYSFSFKGTLRYVWNKLKRFYPLYIVTGLIYIVWSDIPSCIAAHNLSGTTDSFLRLSKYALLLQSYFHDGEYFIFNRAGWFLSSILLAYVLTYPAKCIACRIRKRNGKNRIFIGITAVLAAMAFIYCYLTRELDLEYYHYVFPVARLFEYFSGMSLGYLIYPLSKKEGICEKKGLLTVLEAAILIICILAWFVRFPDWMMRMAVWLVPELLLLAVFGIGGGYVTSILKSRPLVYLGSLSMYCFLLNAPIIQIYYSAVGDAAAVSGTGRVFSIAFTLLVTLLSAMLLARNEGKAGKT